jgi:hypothetical protein
LWETRGLFCLTFCTSFLLLPFFLSYQVATSLRHLKQQNDLYILLKFEIIRAALFSSFCSRLDCVSPNTVHPNEENLY